MSADLVKVASASGAEDQRTIKIDCTNNYLAYEPSLWRGTIEKNAGEMLFRKTRAVVNEELVNKQPRRLI